MLQCELEEEEVADTGLVDRPCSPLSSDASGRIEQLMSLMDINKDGAVTVHEAVQFLSETLPESYLKAASHQADDHVRQLFLDVDIDLDGRLTLSEFLRYFERLKASNYSNSDIIASCEAIIENGLWDVWKRNRQIVHIRAWDASQRKPALGQDSGDPDVHLRPKPAEHTPSVLETDENEPCLCTLPVTELTELKQPHSNSLSSMLFEPSDEVGGRGRLELAKWISNQVVSASNGVAESEPDSIKPTDHSPGACLAVSL